MACTAYEGVDAVKRALKKGLELSTENMPIKVSYIIVLVETKHVHVTASVVSQFSRVSQSSI